MEIANMIDHQKLILENVADDSALFSKELQKSLSWLAPEDSRKLYLWLKEKYWDLRRDEILKVFSINVALIS